MEKIDLHVHTSYSDGALDIESLLKEAKKNKIKTVAITDHETIEGLTGYQKASQKYDIEIIPGIEMNVSHPGMHVLGYGIKDFRKVESVFENIKIKNEQVVFDTIRLLQKNGYDIDEYDVVTAAQEYYDYKKQKLENNSDIFRFNKKFILTKTDVAKTLVNLGYSRNIDDSYKKLIGPNTKNYIRTDKIDTRDAIGLVIDSGGTAVLAHPMTVNIRHTNLINVCKQLETYGLEGIEAYGPRFSDKQKESYISIAKYFGFLMTAGTDFHNPGHTLGIAVPNSVVYNLNNNIKRKNLTRQV